MAQPAWVDQGDRSHPDLVRLDRLKFTLSYPGWEADFRAADEKHLTAPDLFNNCLFTLLEKQRMHHGDRRHPRLVALDSQSWSYPEWQVDFKKAEQAHVEWESDYCCGVHRILVVMKKKQHLHLGGRSHPDLVRLDRLKFTLTYPGWEADFRAAHEKHLTAPDIFNDCLFKLREKQRMHFGYRTHPRLVALDSQSWLYPGWQVDFKNAEQAHVEWESDYCCDVRRILLMMKKKQRLYLSGMPHTTQIASTVEPLQPQESQLQPMDTSYDSMYPDLLQLAESRLGFPALTNEDVFLGFPSSSGRFQSTSSESVTPELTSKNSVSSELSQPEGRLDSKGLTGTCVICMAASKSHAFVPCGHLCVCEACATESFKRSRLCPVCRNRSDVVTQIFFS